MQVLLKLQHYPMPHWATWKSQGGVAGRPQYDSLPADNAIANWGNWATACVKRYKGKVTAIAFTNEPDISFWLGPQLSFEEGVEVYLKLLKAGYEGAKAADPNVLVVGAGSSGYDTGLRFTAAVLNGGKQFLDVYTSHPYPTNKYFGQGRRGAFPEESGLADKCNAAMDMLQEHSMKREMWISELG